MQQIYSKVEPVKLLCVIVGRQDITDKRTDVIPANEFLQLATKSLKKGTVADAHRHNPITRQTQVTQEAWIFLKGSVKATFYDLDNSVIFETRLLQGDCAVLLYGGHKFEVLEDNTLLYEFKTGPFLSIEQDKTFIKV